MNKKVGERKITKHAYFPSSKQKTETVVTEEHTNKDEEGEPNVTINGKPKDIRRFMNPKETATREVSKR